MLSSMIFGSKPAWGRMQGSHALVCQEKIPGTC